MEIYFLLEQHFLVQSDYFFALVLIEVLFQEFLQRVILLLMQRTSLVLLSLSSDSYTKFFFSIRFNKVFQLA